LSVQKYFPPLLPAFYKNQGKTLAKPKEREHLFSTICNMKTTQQLTETLTWTLDNGTLTISGTGAMPNCNYSPSPSYSPSPWMKHLNSITTVNIQNGVTTIGESAFWLCSSLTSITIPDSVTTIGDGAFYLCCSLTSITVSSGNTAYASEDGVLFDKSKETIIAYPEGKTGSYDIPNSVTTIGYRAFYYCRSLTSITIPNSVTTIGGSAFYDCRSLTSITIPNSITTIGDYAFYGCDSLASITVGSGNTAYASEDGVLFNKSKTEIISYPGGKTGSTYNIPNSVTTIGNGAFEDCSSLTSITIPNSVTTIGDAAFGGCRSLTSITIPNSVTTIGGGAFYGCYILTSITIPNSVTTIGNGAFEDCDSLTSITIPNSVTTIEYRAFWYCESLTSITIPSPVTIIGYLAFAGCSSLRDVVVLRTTPPSITFDADYNTFDEVPLDSATLTVPKGSKAAYKAAEGWKDFATITEQ
jgi:hypothetical protein